MGWLALATNSSHDELVPIARKSRNKKNKLSGWDQQTDHFWPPFNGYSNTITFTFYCLSSPTASSGWSLGFGSSVAKGPAAGFCPHEMHKMKTMVLCTSLTPASCCFDILSQLVQLHQADNNDMPKHASSLFVSQTTCCLTNHPGLPCRLWRSLTSSPMPCSTPCGPRSCLFHSNSVVEKKKR